MTIGRPDATIIVSRRRPGCVVQCVAARYFRGCGRFLFCWTEPVSRLANKGRGHRTGHKISSNVSVPGTKREIDGFYDGWIAPDTKAFYPGGKGGTTKR